MLHISTLDISIFYNEIIVHTFIICKSTKKKRVLHKYLKNEYIYHKVFYFLSKIFYLECLFENRKLLE